MRKARREGENRSGLRKRRAGAKLSFPVALELN
jgi:hypothetical protein